MGYFKTFEQFTNLTNESNINEAKIKAPKNGFSLGDIEEILKDEKSISLIIKNKEYFIAPYMHNKGNLSDADDESIFVIDKNNKEKEIKLIDIDYIHV